MKTNKWEAFLSDPELTGSQEYQHIHNGKYLFGKILHDTLECLNNYKAIYSLAVSQEVFREVEISINSLHWFTQKLQAIEFAVSEISQLWNYYQ